MLCWLRCLSLQLSYCHTRACGGIFYETDSILDALTIVQLSVRQRTMLRSLIMILKNGKGNELSVPNSIKKDSSDYSHT